MKRLLFLLLFLPLLAISQTVPTDATQLENIQITNNAVSSTAVNASVQESNGVLNRIPINALPITLTPVNYSIPNNQIISHLSGIDTRLGQISSTSAGITQRVYFTADNTTVNSVVYFSSSLTGKGSTATGSPPALVLGDNTKSFFTKDVISIAQPAATIGYAGTYSGNLTVSASPTPNATQQRFTVEIYRTNNLGVPIASGVSGSPTGDLGVTVVAILDSGVLNLTAGAITNVPVSGILTQNITLNTGERLRYHVSAAKIGIGGGNVTFGVYYGSSYNSYYDVPVVVTTDGVLNKSSVSGITSTDAINTLNNAGSLVYCWGDSMTFGTGSADNNNYPYLLSKTVNWKTVNNGVPGETSTQIKNRFVSFYTSNPDELKKPVIIWAGRNNYPDGTTIKADIATMIAMLPHKNYLVLGITNSNPGEPIGNSGYTQIVTLNNDLKTLYGSRFLDVRAWLVANYNPSLPQDLIDHGLDLPPTSLLSDNIHLNNKGYGLVRDLIAKSFTYLSNQSDIAFESVSARNVYLPNTLNSILKTGANGQITNAAIYENAFNLGLGFVPTSTADTQNFEFVNGGSLMNRVAVPQFAISSNAYGTHYASKYRTSNFSTQILLNGNAGTFEINTAPSGVANANISYYNRFYVTNDGNVGINNTTPTEKLDITGGVRVTRLDASRALYLNTTSPVASGALALEVQEQGVTKAGIYYGGRGIFSEIIKTGGTANQSLQADGSVIALTAGTYTPTLTVGNNMSSLTGQTCSWTRIGDIVTVHIRISFSETANNAYTNCNVSLPISRAGSGNKNTVGIGVINSGDSVAVNLINNLVNISYTTRNGFDNRTCYVSFQYNVTE